MAPVEIVDLPIKSRWIFPWFFVWSYQRLVGLCHLPRGFLQFHAHIRNSREIRDTSRRPRTEKTGVHEGPGRGALKFGFTGSLDSYIQYLLHNIISYIHIYIFKTPHYEYIVIYCHIPMCCVCISVYLYIHSRNSVCLSTCKAGHLACIDPYMCTYVR
jgi:hypothetical protein